MTKTSTNQGAPKSDLHRSNRLVTWL